MEPNEQTKRAGQDIETPIGERSFRVPYAWFWPAVWIGLITLATLATTFVYVTKGEFHDHADEESKALTEHATAEAKVAAGLATQAALHGKELEQHDKMLERCLNFLEAVNTNQATMLREVSVPERRIAKPKDGP